MIFSTDANSITVHGTRFACRYGTVMNASGQPFVVNLGVRAGTEYESDGEVEAAYDPLGAVIPEPEPEVVPEVMLEVAQEFALIASAK